MMHPHFTETAENEVHQGELLSPGTSVKSGTGKEHEL